MLVSDDWFNSIKAGIFGAPQSRGRISLPVKICESFVVDIWNFAQVLTNPLPKFLWKNLFDDVISEMMTSSGSDQVTIFTNVFADFQIKINSGRLKTKNFFFCKRNNMPNFCYL